MATLEMYVIRYILSGGPVVETDGGLTQYLSTMNFEYFPAEVVMSKNSSRLFHVLLT